MSLRGRPSDQARPQQIAGRRQENAQKREAIRVALAELAAGSPTGKPSAEILPCQCGWAKGLTVHPHDKEDVYPMLVARCDVCEKIIAVVTYRTAEERDAVYARVVEKDGAAE